MKKVITIIVCIAYVLWPIDLVPDVIAVAGWIDDAAAIGIAIRQLLSSPTPRVKV